MNCRTCFPVKVRIVLSFISCIRPQYSPYNIHILYGFLSYFHKAVCFHSFASVYMPQRYTFYFRSGASNIYINLYSPNKDKQRCSLNFSHSLKLLFVYLLWISLLGQSYIQHSIYVLVLQFKGQSTSKLSLYIILNLLITTFKMNVLEFYIIYFLKFYLP